MSREIVYQDPATARTERLPSSALPKRAELAERYGAGAQGTNSMTT
jgi:hypothetical protein